MRVILTQSKGQRAHAVVLLLLVTVALALPVRSSVRGDDETVVVTRNGALKGVITDAHRAFLGIPFAAPPVGDLRWAPPLPAAAWNGTFDATAWGPGCPQRCNLPPHMCPEVESEDCLTVNVYTPRVADMSSPAPVFVFLPGGHFEQGGAGVALYDGKFLAEKHGIVLVTVNYRLGALGYAAFGNLQGDGNFGFLDQRLALAWVADNIAAFGGDASRVTLGGQSAGATSTAAHLVSPESYKYFHAAIVMSDPLTLGFRERSEAITIGKAFAKEVGCKASDTACLRHVSIDAILDAQEVAGAHVPVTNPLVVFLPWAPVKDVDPPSQPMQAFPAGKFNRVPLLMGTVADEAVLFVDEAFANPISAVMFDIGIAALFKLQAAGVLKKYPIDKDMTKDTRPLLSTLGTDFLFQCPARFIASAATKMDQNVFLYRFNHSNSYKQSWGPDYPFCQVAEVTCHGSDLPYLFDNARVLYNITEAEAQLTARFGRYFASFIHTHNPNPSEAGDLLHWPAFDASTSETLDFFSGGDVVQPTPAIEHCDFWDSEGYK